MPRTVDEAIAQPGKAPEPSAAEVFEELGPWEGDSYEEVHAILSLARREGASRTPPSLP